MALGARPLKRIIQQKILNPLALKIVIGDVKEGDKVYIDGEEGEIIIKELSKKKLAKVK